MRVIGGKSILLVITLLGVGLTFAKDADKRHQEYANSTASIVNRRPLSLRFPHIFQAAMKVMKEKRSSAAKLSNVTTTGNKSETTTDHVLPVTIKIDGVTKKSNSSEDQEQTNKPELLPEAQELRYARPMMPGTLRRRYQSIIRRPLLPAVNRRNVYQDRYGRPSATLHRPIKRPTERLKRPPTENECTFFTHTVCLEAVDYPIEAIMRSIRSNKEMVSALLTDYKVHNVEVPSEPSDDDVNSYKSIYDSEYDRNNQFENNEIKRKYEDPALYDNVEEGFTCPSQVKYARPQLARAATGTWKYIINTGEHTQTLRLEKCSNPRTSCSFISQNYKSSCVQVYNYHRLLSWDPKVGLHMDIFKVPSCCSCHVHGYADLYPPNTNDPPPKAVETFPGADFAVKDQPSFADRYRPTVSPRDNYLTGESLSSSSSLHRPSYSRPTSNVVKNTDRQQTPRPKKQSVSSSPSSQAPRPFEKIAPNTRAPGYAAPARISNNRSPSGRPPFRRESLSTDASDYQDNFTNGTNESETGRGDKLSMRLPNPPLDDDYEDSSRNINFRYHPILDYFKPEALALKSESPTTVRNSPGPPPHLSFTTRNDQDWRPIIKP